MDRVCRLGRVKGIQDVLNGFIAVAVNVEQVTRLMTQRRIHVVEARVLVMGLTFKENCPDLRNTRVIDIITEFDSLHANVDVYDPWVNRDRGDETELDALVERYWPRLLAYIRLHADPVIRRHESCADVALSVCREALAERGRFEYQGEPAFVKWLCTKAMAKLGWWGTITSLASQTWNWTASAPAAPAPSIIARPSAGSPS